MQSKKINNVNNIKKHCHRVMICTMLMIAVTVSLIGCGIAPSTDKSDANSIDSSSSLAENSIESEEITEAEQIENGDADMIARISELVGCGERTAETIYNTVARRIESETTQIEKEEDSIYIKLIFETENGEIYVVLVGDGNLVEEIYKGSIDGECIYRAIL